MDGATFRDAVETAKATQLDRLGSEKLLLALTDATLDTPAVLTAAALSEHAATETFEQWAADEPSDIARAAFESTAAQEQAHFDRIVSDLEAFTPPESPGPLHSYLRGLDDTVPRVAGGLVGRPLVSLRAHTQVISFFINEADQQRADRFRDLKAETEAELTTGLDLLEDLCPETDAWDDAQSIAEYTIQVAYDDYADGLTKLGLDPKPLC